MNTEQVEALTVLGHDLASALKARSLGSLAIHKSITGKNGGDQAGLREAPINFLHVTQRGRQGRAVRQRQRPCGFAREFSAPQANGV